MNFQNARIGTKLWLAVGLFIAALAALIAFASVRAQQSQSYADKVLTLAETKIALATRWTYLTEGAVNRAMANAINTDAGVTKVLGDANTAAIAKITELQKQLKELPQSEAEQALTQKIATLRQTVLDASGKVTKLKDGGDLEGARKEAATVFQPAVAPYLQALNDFVKLQEDASAAARQQIAADRKLTLTIAMVVVAFIIGGMLVGTHLLVKSIRTPLLDAVSLANRIAGGDLGHKQQVTRGDEMGELMRALLAMNESLARTVGQVRSAADSIQTASTEIASGNTDLSRRTEETASNLQKTASAIEQLTGTVGQSADSARTANQLASSAAQVAHRGGEVVSQVVSTMDEINTASKRISDIIGTIDGIAFQTNILALNAAVEAARAGEQGRGFAVVASEVRSLAQRSAEAAREIKTLIGASVDKVESGSKLVADAGSTMDEIVASVQRVSDIIGEVMSASDEQSQGIGRVNGAVSELDQMTQQNAALVEQSSAAAESLKEQAARLGDVVRRFTLAPSA
ncbi:MAG: methyl-accepting chemotaxis protein [Rubrivivax sp.]